MIFVTLRFIPPNSASPWLMRLRTVPTIMATPSDRLGMPSERQRAKILDQRDIRQPHMIGVPRVQGDRANVTTVRLHPRKVEQCLDDRAIRDLTTPALARYRSQGAL